jgi:endonuclease YncB( thermonuclease family)
MNVVRLGQRALLCTTVLLTACAPAVAQSPISGIGKSIDGDSLHVDDKEVRLFGIDAPEFDQTCQRASGDWSCGAAAADQLSDYGGLR